MKINTLIADRKTGEIVNDDYRTATVFDHFDIDYCCQGGQTVREACRAAKLSLSEVCRALEQVVDSPPDVQDRNMDCSFWPLDLLADYIEKKHHRYVLDQIPVVEEYLDKVVAAHGQLHPELGGIRELFHESAAELTVHMRKEELILFPFIRKQERARNETGDTPHPGFNALENPISIMKQDHAKEGERFREIRRLARQYLPPEDACNTYRVTYRLLQAFEEDLHLHIHLENNVLFPRSLGGKAKSPGI
ncbi:MAG TPA: iron-sulfur cluster repair di-iron protein [Puia sp.]|nr:iron-sulfur cluster repair di-iron protein [Puia sp.]